MIKQLYKQDDGTQVLYQYDVGNQFAWDKTTRYFDDDGRKTQDVYDFDSGSHTIYQYDVAGNVTSTDGLDADRQLIT